MKQRFRNLLNLCRMYTPTNSLQDFYQPGSVFRIDNKKRMKFLLLIVFLLINYLLFAQTKNNDYQEMSLTKENIRQRTWQGYIKPLALVDPLTGTLQAGLQKDIKPHFAIALDYGLKLPALSYYYHRSERQHYHYSKSSLEIKYYLKRIKRWEAVDGYTYVSLQAFYFPQHYLKTNDFLTLNGTSFHYDESTIKRTVVAYNAALGYQLFKERIAFNVYTGIGIRKIRLQQQPEGLQPGWPVEPVELHFISLDRQQGDFVRLNLLLGARIGYRF